MMYTKDGKVFHFEGDLISLNGTNYYFVSASWLIEHGYYPYKIVEGTGTDGVVEGEYVHYVEPVTLEEDEPTE